MARARQAEAPDEEERAPSSRSNGTSLTPCAQYVKFTERDNTRLHRVRRYRGVTVQTLIHTATMRAIIEIETEMAREVEAGNLPRPQVSQMQQETGGLGIYERLDKMRRAEDEERARRVPVQQEPAPQVPQQQVVVQVQAGPTVPTDEIAALAKYVVEGGAGYLRPDRLKEAMEKLARRCKTRDEAVVLGERLDTEIAKIKKPSVLEKVRSRMNSRRTGK